MSPPSRFVYEVSCLGKSSLLQPRLPGSDGGFLPPWRDYSSSCPLRPCLQGVTYLRPLTLKRCSLTWVDVQTLPVRAVSEHSSGCVALAVYVLPPVWLRTGQNFHLASRKFREKLGDADNSQIRMRVSLNCGRVSIAMFWGKRGVWGGKRKCPI